MLLFCCLSCHSSVLPSAPPKQHTGSHVRLQCRRRCAGQHRMRLEICMQGFCYVRPGRADIVLGPNTLMRTLSQAKACTHTYTHIHLDPSLHFSSYTHTHTHTERHQYICQSQRQRNNIKDWASCGGRKLLLHLGVAGWHQRRGWWRGVRAWRERRRWQRAGQEREESGRPRKVSSYH